jgi:hypothetical protein
MYGSSTVKVLGNIEREAIMLEGSCLCGAVRYRAEGPLQAMARCHCRECRKASGAEFATNGSVLSENFHILEGNDALAEFESSPGNFRVFCQRCGSPLFKRKTSDPTLVRIRLGSLDSELDQRPLVHVFVREKPAWSDINDTLLQFETAPGR